MLLREREREREIERETRTRALCQSGKDSTTRNAYAYIIISRTQIIIIIIIIKRRIARTHRLVSFLAFLDLFQSLPASSSTPRPDPSQLAPMTPTNSRLRSSRHVRRQPFHLNPFHPNGFNCSFNPFLYSLETDLASSRDASFTGWSISG